MIKYYIKKNLKELKQNIFIFARPFIYIILYYLLSANLGPDSTIILFGLLTMLFQLDIIITTNYSMFLLINSKRIIDIQQSKQNINKVIILESLSALLLYFTLQAISTYAITHSIELAMFTLLISLISLVIGLSLLHVTYKYNHFLNVSKIAQISLFTGCVIIPLSAFPLARPILLLNIYTPINELIRQVYFNNHSIYSFTTLLTATLIDLILLLILAILSYKKLQTRLISHY